MGQTGSAETDPKSGGSAATPALTSGTPIYVNVYEPNNAGKENSGAANAAMNVPGFGVWHSGLEVLGTEYVYAGGGGSGTGVYTQRVRWQPNGSPWKYKESIQLGFTALTSKDEILALCKTIESEFPASGYHLTNKNCNHFTERFAQVLGVGAAYPAWINRAAKTGGSLASMLGVDPMKIAGQLQSAGGGAQGQPLEPIKPIEIVDLLPALDAKHVSCLNQASAHGIENVCDRKNPKKYLESDCDDQLLIFLPFTKIVKMHALEFAVYPPQSPNAKYNPKCIKLFANARNMDFQDAAASTTPTLKLAVDQLIVSAVKAAGGGSDGGGGDKKTGADDALMISVALPLVKFQVNTFIVRTEF